MTTGSVDILPEPTPPRRTRKPKAGEGEETPVAAGAGTPVVAPPASTAETPAAPPTGRRKTPAAATTTPATPAEPKAAEAPTAAPAEESAPPSAPDAPPAAPATPVQVAQRAETETPAVYPASTQQPTQGAPAEPTSDDVPIDPPAVILDPPAPTAPTPTPTTAAPTPAEAGARDDTSAGVRALQEAFALDVAEREDRHRAEVRAMQQSFMADVNAREDRHRAEVQALHQRSTADLATRDERHRTEVQALQQELDAARAQLTETTSARDAQSEARVSVETDLEQQREEGRQHRAEIERLTTQNDDLATSLATSQQQTTKWTEQAQRLDKELSTTRTQADKAATTAAKQYADKSKQLDETQRELAETVRKLEAAEERGARLSELSAAHEAAAAQLRTTVAEQRAERERVTADRDEARQRAVEFEGQLRTAEFEAEQAAEEANRQHTDLQRQIEEAEEKVARVAGQSAVHEATAEELRNVTSDQDLELKKATVARDAAQRRVAELEAEVARLHRAVQVAREAVAAGIPALPDEKPTAVTAKDPETSEPTVATELSEDKPLSLAEEIELADWQREALTRWAASGRRGVVEAISGADITPVAYWAIADALDQDMKVLVITAAEQVDAWFNGLRAALPINRVGKAAVGQHERHAAYDVVVATVDDAARESAFGANADVMLVADQVHEYGTRGHSPALDPEYSWRLGLTDLYERDDNGISTYLDPYFGGVSFSLGYDRALADEVIAPFDIAVVSVRLSSAEQSEYDALGKQTKDLAATLVSEFGAPSTEKFGEAVAALAGGRLGPARNAARSYQKAAAKRSELVANASGKSSVLRALAGRIRTGESALVFAQTSQAAAHVTKVFGGEGCATRSLSGGAERGFRARRAVDGGGEEVVLLAGSRSVVDGGRLPEVDLGIVIGAAGSTRQVMERLGQVVRPTESGRHGRLVTVYVTGTDEDDVNEGSASPIDRYAAQVSELDGAESDALLDFLAAKVAADDEASDDQE